MRILTCLIKIPILREEPELLDLAGGVKLLSQPFGSPVDGLSQPFGSPVDNLGNLH